jgi:hypothetical protein
MGMQPAGGEQARRRQQHEEWSEWGISLVQAVTRAGLRQGYDHGHWCGGIRGLGLHRISARVERDPVVRGNVDLAVRMLWFGIGIREVIGSRREGWIGIATVTIGEVVRLGRRGRIRLIIVGSREVPRPRWWWGCRQADYHIFGCNKAGAGSEGGDDEDSNEEWLRQSAAQAMKDGTHDENSPCQTPDMLSFGGSTSTHQQHRDQPRGAASAGLPIPGSWVQGVR